MTWLCEWCYIYENNKTPLGAQVIYLLHSIRVNMNNKPLQNKYLKCAPQNVRKVPTFCVFQDPEAESRGSYAWGWIFPAEATFEGPGCRKQFNSINTRAKKIK